MRDDCLGRFNSWLNVLCFSTYWKALLYYKVKLAGSFQRRNIWDGLKRQCKEKGVVWMPQMDCSRFNATFTHSELLGHEFTAILTHSMSPLSSYLLQQSKAATWHNEFLIQALFILQEASFEFAMNSLVSHLWCLLWRLILSLLVYIKCSKSCDHIRSDLKDFLMLF